MSDQTKLEGDMEIHSGDERLADLGNGISDAVHKALTEGLGVDFVCSVLVGVAADYWMQNYSEPPMALAGILELKTRAPVAADAAPESKLASNERPEGIPNLPSPGWHEAIEEAAKVAEKYALDQESCERLQAETICYVIRDAIRSLLPPGGEGLKK